MTLFPSQVASANAVLKGEEVIDLPVADLFGHTEPLQPVDRVDLLFTNTSMPNQSDDAREPGRDGPDDSDRRNSDPVEADIDVDLVFQQGWEAGQREALAAAESDRRIDGAMTESVVQALAAVEAAIDRAGSDRKEASVELALELARLVLDRELEVATNPGRDALIRCLGDVPVAKRAVFRFHPDDLARLDDGRELLAGRSSELVADPTVARGDVLVDIDGGLIDGGIMNALERVAEVLRG